jgi:hypothetical protein
MSNSDDFRGVSTWDRAPGDIVKDERGVEWYVLETYRGNLKLRRVDDRFVEASCDCYGLMGRSGDQTLYLEGWRSFAQHQITASQARRKNEHQFVLTEPASNISWQVVWNESGGYLIGLPNSGAREPYGTVLSILTALLLRLWTDNGITAPFPYERITDGIIQIHPRWCVDVSYISGCTVTGCKRNHAATEAVEP